ncbi:MAG: 23S rRNA (guanosine(2251)-2'-O)-methyltransferase RlmB [Oscillospiraceae bacterium]|jgi:23S rRNA (guanosine2251-2'-O)-methyltransferase|nr:23S rRNA (guanosine(2251)-2'-O)-methyltransferase RlmB [Oscillospiraceae bacterium]
MIEGKNAVAEALKADRAIDKIFVADGNTDRVLGEIVRAAAEKRIVVTFVDRRALDKKSETHAHQGVIAMVPKTEYAEVSDIVAIAENRGEAPLIIICDEISDPRNLGAILRVAECSGAHGVIISKRRGAGLSSAIVEKSSAGAASYIPVARVSNINAAIRELKAANIRICGADADADSTLWDLDFTIPIAIVIGSEGSGLRRLVSENCDFIASIPMKGQISSLNASNAAAVLMYEVLRQRANGRQSLYR